MPAAPPPSLARRHLALPGAPALGWVEAEASVGGLTRVRFLEDAPVGRSAGSQAQPEAGNEQGEVRAAAAHLAHFAEELAAYLRGARGPFTVPVQASGTAFQREVWGALRLLNHGALTTYGELAAEFFNTNGRVATAPEGDRLLREARDEMYAGIELGDGKVLHSELRDIFLRLENAAGLAAEVRALELTVARSGRRHAAARGRSAARVPPRLFRYDSDTTGTEQSPRN